MELYWKLASIDGAVRESASVALVRDLQALHEAYQQELRKERGSQQLAEEVLLAAANDDEEGLQNCAPGIQYALRRLVRGVSSSRESARQGFAMALASVLEALPSIKTGSILKLIKKNLDVTSSMKGQEIRDGLLGQLFALGAVVRAGRFDGDGMETEQKNLAREITEQLLSLAGKKHFLRESAITVLLQLIDRLAPSSLQESVLSSQLLQEMLCTDIGNGNADLLLLALRLNEQLPTFVRQSCPMLPDSGNLHDIFLPSHLSSLVPILKDSSSSHPRLHPLWGILVELLMTESKESNLEGLRSSAKKKKKRQKVEPKGMFGSLDQQLASFWSIVVDKALLTSSHERKHLVLELLHLCLPKLSALSARIVLSSTFVRCLLDILAAQDTHLYKSAQRFLHFLCEWAKEDEHRSVVVILSLQQGSRGKFDMLSKTPTLKQLLSNLSSKDSCFLLYQNLVDLFNGQRDELPTIKQLHLFNGSTDQLGTEKGNGVERDKPGTDVGKTQEIQRYWVLEQICSLRKQLQLEPGLGPSFQKQILKFLTVHALFVGPSGTTSTIQELNEVVKWPEVSISENTRQLCLARLQDVLVELSLFKDKNKTRTRNGLAESNGRSEDLRVFFLQFCELFSAIPDVTWAHNVSEGDGASIDALRMSMLQLSSAAQQTDGERNERIHAMFSLLMQLHLQSMTSHVNEIAMELIICCKKTFGEFLDIDVEDDDHEQESPDIMDVLMDVLLSLLAQPSAPIRAAAEQVFKSFCGDMKESALLSLLRVVKRQPKSSRRKEKTSMDVEDSDEDQILEIEDSEEDINDPELQVNEIEDRAPDHGDLSTDYDNEDDDKQPTRIQSQDMKEMGSEANNGVDSPTSDSEMDDEAMFRIDSHLAKILKQKAQGANRGDAKDAQTQLLHFKFRVLSLIEFFLQKKAKSALAITALPHLLQTFVLSCSVDGNAQLADRIGSILQAKLFKSKQYPKGLELNNLDVDPLLQRSLKLASRSRIKKVGAVAQACSLWLLKILQSQQHHEDNGHGKIKDIVQDAMIDFFSHKKSCLKSSFFREVFIRFPRLGISNLGMLLERCLNSRSEYLQYEAVLLVNTVLCHKPCREPSQSSIERCELQVCLKQYLPTVSEVLANLLGKPPSKAARRSEARRFCVSLLKTISRMFPKKPLRKLIGESTYNLCLSQLGTSAVESTLKSEVMNVPDSKFEKPELGSRHKKTSKEQSG